MLITGFTESLVALQYDIHVANYQWFCWYPKEEDNEEERRKLAEEAARSEKMLQDDHQAFRNALLVAQLTINQVKQGWTWWWILRIYFKWKLFSLKYHIAQRERERENLSRR